MDTKANKQCHLALQKARAPEEPNIDSVGFCETTEISAGKSNRDL